MDYLIVLSRTLLFYIIITIIYRFMGKREIGQLGIVDLISGLIITIFNYFNILPNVLKYFKVVLIVLSFFIGGSYIGREAQNKGYLEGIKIAVVSIVILFLLSYAGFGNKPNLSLLIYYLIIFLSCIFGSIIGINKSKKEN